MKKFLYILLTSLLFTSCNFFIQFDPNLIKPNEWDSKNIPDSYNCGADDSVDFTSFSATGELYPGVTLVLRSDTNQYNFSYYQNKNLKTDFTIKNYDFSEHDFVTNSLDKLPGVSHITFENCKFKGFRHEAVSPTATGKVYFTFNNCSFSGNVSNSYITLNNCKIGGFTSDAMNPLREFYANNLYVYDLEHEANLKGTHIDGIQIFGDQRSRNTVENDKWISKVETGEIHYNNVRFEIPSIHFDEENKSYVNACVMFQLEYSGVDNVSFRNLYVNGGGKWYPLYMDHGKNRERSEDGLNWSHKNLIMENAMVSNNFGKIFYPDLLEDAKITNVDHHNYLFVTSVWKDEKGTAHLMVTNDTNSDKTLVVKTNVGTYNFEIPHCPSNWALGGEIDTKTNPKESLTDSKGRAYTTYRYEDLPFDLEFTIPNNPDFILCYQGEEQIRYVSFDGEKHRFSEIIQP